MLQLQRVPPSPRSAFTSNRTAPQWQVPEWVSFDWFMAFELPSSAELEHTDPECKLYVIFATWVALRLAGSAAWVSGAPRPGSTGPRGPYAGAPEEGVRPARYQGRHSVGRRSGPAPASSR